jgi:hypothetical protein
MATLPRFDSRNARTLARNGFIIFASRLPYSDEAVSAKRDEDAVAFRRRGNASVNKNALTVKLAEQMI